MILGINLMFDKNFKLDHAKGTNVMGCKFFLITLGFVTLGVYVG